MSKILLTLKEDARLPTPPYSLVTFFFFGAFGFFGGFLASADSLYELLVCTIKICPDVIRY